MAVTRIEGIPYAHPLSPLSINETVLASDIVRALHPDTVLHFRVVYLREPSKDTLVKFLELEHAGQLTAEIPRPPRLASVHYVVVEDKESPQSIEAVVDLDKRELVWHKAVRTDVHPSFTLHELEETVRICKESTLLQSKISALSLPDGFDAVIEPWPYGGLDSKDENRRYFQALVFAVDTQTENPDANFYSYPLPLIPVVDWVKQEVVRVDELATGGGNDSYHTKIPKQGIIDHCRPSEYVPELLKTGLRSDLKELNVVQPNGPSFSVKDESLVEWQKWRMRVSFNPREGAVLHDVLYDGRSILYRLSISDMTVPYADPRSPFHRKQAFDFGDGGIGHCANNLELGCDCLGVIKYFDGVLNRPDGSAHVSRNVICLHEQDNGIGWKHTNWRTNRAVVTRRRELVIQFILTVANYEYVFNYKFDQAGGITVETRATGILSAVNIDVGKTAPWGNIVSPGVLAQNHQHIFCVRIDPAIDGHENTLVQQDSLPLQVDAKTNPNGNAYSVQETSITTSTGLDAAPQHARLFKIQNFNKRNPVSGKPVGYKIVPPPTQLLLANPHSRQAKRALFAQRHLWVTKYKDDELYAGGRYTLQSTIEEEGVSDAAARCDDVVQTDIVIWSVFGLTHNPRVEDWPVMPVETIQLHITPVDFFTGNPALDVPSNRNLASQYAQEMVEGNTNEIDLQVTCCN
ncbi:copper amine oxidase 1 [Colletotrichum liriopes]|uniref:Amine oxidase n=1 Tax=Colletotrichum liriopes TaxID=708192 RepID=A0AA37GIP8_9PEZI|nr:copper amine oxidase 1 [Colletotrichum liriopes]